MGPILNPEMAFIHHDFRVAGPQLFGGGTPGALSVTLLVGGRMGAGFARGEAGSSSVGAVSGVSTARGWSRASFSNGTTLAKSRGGIRAVAPCMNSSQIGNAAWAPVSFFARETC